MTNKYFEISKKTTIDYKEGRIDAEDFKKTFEKLDKTEIYENLKINGYIGMSNFISAVSELDDQSTLESQWIIEIINLFYCYFIDNYDYVYSEDFYKFLKFGLKKENKNPVKTSFNKAAESCFKKEINTECLGYIANEFLNNLSFFEKEIKEDKKLLDILKVTTKLKTNRILEDLTPIEEKKKLEIIKRLENYLIS